jgi:hypothetical protein
MRASSRARPSRPGETHRAASADADLARLDRLARLLDSSLRVPGTGIRLGLDSLIGLVPGVGDAAALLVSAYIVAEARRHGASKGLILRMLGNVAIDSTVGAIPVLGDAFDIFWRANQRNLRLLRAHLERRSRV